VCSLTGEGVDIQETLGNVPFFASFTKSSIGTTWAAHSGLSRMCRMASYTVQMYPPEPWKPPSYAPSTGAYIFQLTPAVVSSSPRVWKSRQG
jgi:hypothetical protein